MSQSSYKKLVVWEKSMKLVDEVYRATKKFPLSETNNLISQMQRAAVSIPSNIAEGQYRFSVTQNRQFLKIAYGSCAELETQVAIATSLRYLSRTEVEMLTSLIEEILRMLNKFILVKVGPSKI